ncbi:hypothetical protein [uncultured Aquimarina sp.]|uniref:hypothetical protein n=1 Tax=uncultured Aquimarina sp. TaxID=575652 RepID=UPI00261DE64D|nr:hypothetical protein [uncultured Aquimarina sp.]
MFRFEAGIRGINTINFVHHNWGIVPHVLTLRMGLIPHHTLNFDMGWQNLGLTKGCTPNQKLKFGSNLSKYEVLNAK